MRRPLAAAVLIVPVAVGSLWALRFRIADDFVDRRLEAAHVPASYRLTRLGPFFSRLEDVRIGDPARPDLVARRIDVRLGYGWAGPVVTSVAVDGVRLRATLDAGGLHLGAIDRLLPTSRGGKTVLPDLDVTLADVGLALETPNGAIATRLSGRGNPTKQFDGHALVDAKALRLASCALDGVAADMAVSVARGTPRVAGPVRIAATACPSLKLGPGVTRIAATSDRTFERVSLRAELDGFGGAAGPARFDRLAGPLAAAGRLGSLRIRSEVQVAGLVLPAARITIPAGTPISPTGARAADTVTRLLARSDASVRLAAAIEGADVAVHVARATLAGGGGRIAAVARGGIDWSPKGWRFDGDLTTGGALPAIALAVRQARPGAPLTATGSIAPYRAGSAQVAAPSIRLGWDGHRVAFAAQTRIDGPIGDGFVTGLALPIDGIATPSGDIAAGSGCRTLAFRTLRLAGFRFEPAHLPLCGRPIVRVTGGRIRIDAASGPVRLTGATASGAPLLIATDRLHLSERGFDAAGLLAELGEPDRQTRFAVGELSGGFTGGIFAATSGRIGAVPILFSDAAGTWRFAGGRLDLDGRITASDAIAPKRFEPLVAQNAHLSLVGGRITATAGLGRPGRPPAILHLDLAHDLSSGQGHALLDVPGITFVPKGLQPEQLTPLTLGVVANLAGTVSGKGRIDWTAEGVTSTGDFRTDRLDLAAAFGPVSGIKGAIHFNDLLGMMTAETQEVAIAEINPGVAVANGLVRYRIDGPQRIVVEDASWPFAGGTLRLDATTLDFTGQAERKMTFRLDGLDAAAFVQQLEFPNIAATGTFDGVLPMLFDQSGGRIEGGTIVARAGGGSLAYVGELSNAELGTMGKLAFDALKAIRYSALDIRLDGRLDGEMVSLVRFTGVREATPGQTFVTKLIRNLPFRFNIAIHAPFRGLVGSARAYMDPRMLLNNLQPPTTPAEPAVQSPDSAPVR